jgi:p70 ribosomal S6 kinase
MVVMADVAGPLVAPRDAADLVDACDIVDAIHDLKIDSSSMPADDKGHADFDAFCGARTLQGETVADAKAAAAEEQAIIITTTTTTTDTPPQETEIKIDEKQKQQQQRSRFVTPKDFDLLKVIGMGAFGKVLQVKNKQSGQVLAMKVISKRLLKRKAGYIENVQAERNILMRVNHPFVVNMHCSFQTKEKLFIIMDFLAGGELFLRLGREGIFLEKDAAFYLAEIILGVDHLHSLGVLHRDLKPENILLGNDGHICLTDFGLAKDFGPDWNADQEDGERARTVCGTLEYMAPEMVAHKGYSKAADYWSLGCIAYEMLSGLPPFSSKQGSKELFRKIMGEKVKMPPGSTAAACKLLKGILNRNPDARLGAARSTMFEVGGVAGLKQAAFFAKIDWTKLERRELEPPCILTVDNEDDLRHFHNEFTSMPLPRSVNFISSLDDLPRRVNSNTFRGFSFIQPHFSLPERNITDIETYWNSHPEEEGDSDSDLASSKCDGEAALALEAGKKKRPPRKRKKKTKEAETASTATSLASEEGGNPKETSSAPPPKETPADAGAKQDDATATPALVAEPPKKETQQATLVPAKVPTEPPKKLATPARKPQVEAWQSSDPKKTRGNRRQEPQQTPPARVGMNNRAAALGSSPMSRQQATPQKTPQRHAVQQQPNGLGWGTPTATPQRAAAPPGSWAARIQKQTPSAVTTPSSTMAEPRTPWTSSQKVPPPPPPPSTPTPTHNSSFSPSQGSIPSPSSDWRQHSSSPQVQRTLHHTVVRSSPDKVSLTAKKVLSAAAPAWPSLSDFPTAPAGSTVKTEAATQGAWASAKQQTNKPLKGAWASKGKS